MPKDACTRLNIKTLVIGAREMAQQLRELDALTEDPSLIPNTHMTALYRLHNFSSGDSDIPSWPLQASDRQTLTYIK